MSEQSSDQRPAVASIHLSIRTRQASRHADEAMVVPGAGLMGCRHSKPGNERAILLIDGETLDELGLEPGEVKENLTTRGLDLRALGPGVRLQIGETAVLEVTGPCDPCGRMDEIRPGLRGELQGRRGLNTRVRVGGRIRRGDEIRMVQASAGES